MNYLKNLSLSFLISSSCYLFFSSLPALANPKISNQDRPEPSFISWLNQVFLSNKPPINPRKTGSRHPNSTLDNFVCMVSPDAPKTTRVIWSNRPLLIWQGKVKQVVVRNKSNGNKWIRYITDNQNVTTYSDEKPLQPGQSYEWRVIFQDELSMGVNFKVMEAQQRDRITSDLTNLENQLTAQGQDTEAIALAKANYFAENQLWSDVLQQIYSVKTPTPELEKLRTQISQNLCNS